MIKKEFGGFSHDLSFLIHTIQHDILKYSELSAKSYTAGKRF